MTAAITTYQLSGWIEQISDGAATVYLAIADEGMVTGPTDTPANAEFIQCIANPESFSIRRAPVPWPEGDPHVQAAAFGKLQIFNYDGQFNNLLERDLRDATVVIKFPVATLLTSGTQMLTAITICTGVIESVVYDGQDLITINIKDTLARLDKPLPCKFNPPFVASGAANAMVPLTFGSVRNRAPLLIDEGNRLYQLHDANIPNITSVSDKAAPLDPHAAPPQYVPALNGTGFQVETLPEGKIVVDCASYGTQSVIPGVNDVLAGAGAFPGTWNSGLAEVTTSPVSLVSGEYRFITAAHSIPVGHYIFLSDGTNSIYGPIASIFGGTQYRVTAAASTVTGTPTSIPVGSTVRDHNPPTGFTFTGGLTNSIAELTHPPYPLGANTAVQIITSKVFYPAGGKYGANIAIANELIGGASYRLNFSLFNVQSDEPYFIGGMKGGVMVSSALSGNANDYISGYLQPLNSPVFSSQNYSFEFTVPSGSARPLYFIVVPSAGNAPANAIGSGNATIFGVTLELLGTFTQLPQAALPLQDYFTEILIDRAGEDSSIFNTGEAQALCTRDDGTYIPWGVAFDTPPNILDALRIPVVSLKGGVIFTDNVGTLRVRPMVDPADPDNQTSIKAKFNTHNVKRPPIVSQDRATMLTTQFGCRPNQSVFSNSDFVTDTSIVTLNTKTRFTRKSQIIVNASVSPAGMYSHAIGALIFDTCIDDEDDCQDMADDIVSIFSAKIYRNGTVATGKCLLVTFTASYDSPAVVGIDTTCAVTDIMYGDIVQFDYQNADGSTWFDNVYGSVEAWEIIPFAKQIKLTIRVRVLQ